MRRVILFVIAAFATAVAIALSVVGLPHFVSGWSLKGTAAGVHSSSPREAMLAGQYHLRNRTKAFFERGARTPHLTTAAYPSLSS